MAKIEAKLEELGLTLPGQVIPPAGMRLPFAFVRITGNHAYISGHVAQAQDGSFAEPIGKLGKELTVEQGYEAAKLITLSMLGSLKRELGDLDRVTKWLKVLGMVNCTPEFNQTPQVINGFSDFIIELYGQEAGTHARSAVGMGSLPNNITVEVEAIVEIRV